MMSEELSEPIEPKITRQDLIDNLEMMIKSIEELPAHAMISPINHYDFTSLLILLHGIFSMEDKPQS